jgi:hypothetical protein
MEKYMSYGTADRAEPWAVFYNEHVLPAHPDAMNALKKGALPVGSLPAKEQVANLLQPGYTDSETGYTLETDGSQRVAVLTRMPGVSPEMWDWWFGWHGCRDSRYKLWHPVAHRAAAWADGRDDVAYIGRVSQIEEYIGKTMEKANIAFRHPVELGFPEAALSDKTKDIFICARVGYTRWPIDFGWLVHQIRRTDDGAEMRSRFFMGGPHIQIRWPWMPAFVSKILQKMVRLPEQQAIDLLNHCSEEMNHLAGFLPELYRNAASIP